MAAMSNCWLRVVFTPISMLSKSMKTAILRRVSVSVKGVLRKCLVDPMGASAYRPNGRRRASGRGRTRAPELGRSRRRLPARTFPVPSVAETAAVGSDAFLSGARTTSTRRGPPALFAQPRHFGRGGDDSRERPALQQFPAPPAPARHLVLRRADRLLGAAARLDR